MKNFSDNEDNLVNMQLWFLKFKGELENLANCNLYGEDDERFSICRYNSMEANDMGILDGKILLARRLLKDYFS